MLGVFSFMLSRSRDHASAWLYKAHGLHAGGVAGRLLHCACLGPRHSRVPFKHKVVHDEVEQGLAGPAGRQIVKQAAYGCNQLFNLSWVLLFHSRCARRAAGTPQSRCTSALLRRGCGSVTAVVVALVVGRSRRPRRSGPRP